MASTGLVTSCIRESDGYRVSAYKLLILKLLISKGGCARCKLMLNLIARVVTSIGEADDREHLSDVIQAAMTRLGFDSFSLSCHKHDVRQLISEPALTTWRKEAMAEYSDHFSIEQDPLLTYVTAPDRPRIWSIREWQTPQFINYARFLAQRGVRSGVTARLSRQKSAISVISAISGCEETVCDETATAIYVIGQAGMLRLKSLEVTDPTTAPPNTLTCLSADQIEILEWARQGKSNGDIALITGRSKRTVAYHMSQILQKLCVSTRAQAVALYAGK